MSLSAAQPSGPVGQNIGVQTAMIVEDEAIVAFSHEDAFLDEGTRSSGLFPPARKPLPLSLQERRALAIVEATLRDGPCLELARELCRRAVPFLIYSGRDAFEEPPPELDGIMWIEKPAALQTVVRAASALIGKKVARRSF